MSDLCSVQLVGRIVKDAELKKTTGGKSVAVFTVANNRFYKDSASGELVEKTSFFPLAIFGPFADKMTARLKKGQLLSVEGYLKQDTWVKDGVKRSATNIAVSRINLIFGGKSSGQSKGGEEIPGGESESFEFADEQAEEMYYEEPAEEAS